MGGERESERGREGERAWVENGAISPLPGCVLQMTLKSSCSQAAPLLLASLSLSLSLWLARSLRGNSKQCLPLLGAGCLLLCWREESGGKGSPLPLLPSRPFWHWAVARPSNLSGRRCAAIGCLVPTFDTSASPSLTWHLPPGTCLS